MAGLAMAFVGIAVSLRQRWPLYAAGAAAGVVALGSGSPMDLWAIAQRFPLYDSLRVPSRFLVGSLFALAVAAGFGLCALVSSLAVRRPHLARAIALGVPAAIYIELLAMGWSLFADIFVCRPVELPRHESFAQRVAHRYTLNRRCMSSATYPYLAANSGVLHAYERMAVPQGEVRLEGDPGYRGEAYLEAGHGLVQTRWWGMSAVGFDVELEAPDRLVLNQNYYRGWTATVRDASGSVGRRAAEANSSGLVSVIVRPGDREVELRYRPASFVMGAALSAVSLAGCAVLLFRRPRVGHLDRKAAKSPRRTGATFALLVTTLAALLGIGELAVRRLGAPGAAADEFDPYRPDPWLGYALRLRWETRHVKPDFDVVVRTNDLGLRGRPVQPAKPRGVVRVLVLGDSFAFGFGVGDAESFPSRLEDLLSERLARRVEVLNAAVPGWSTDQQLVFLRTRGFELEPDLVILATSENDVEDLGWNRHEFDADGLPSRVESRLRLVDPEGRLKHHRGGPRDVPQVAHPGENWLTDHSSLYRWLRYQVTIAVAMHRAATGAALDVGPSPDGAIEQLTPLEIERGLLWHGDFRLRYHRRLVTVLEDDCDARGLHLVHLLVAFRTPNPDPTSALELHADCRARKARCLDTADLFPSEVEGFFHPQDGHWSSAAHREVARALAERLLALGLLAPAQAEGEAPGS